jgi:hypothetical protein
MDFQYTFRQAHQDRLEDAGIIQRRPVNFLRAVGHRRQTQPRAFSTRQRLIFTTILNIISK